MYSIGPGGEHRQGCTNLGLLLNLFRGDIGRRHVHVCASEAAQNSPLFSLHYLLRPVRCLFLPPPFVFPDMLAYTA